MKKKTKTKSTKRRGLPAKESVVAVKTFITPKGNRRVILKTNEVDEYEE